MKVSKLEPSGFCFGVQRSYEEALKIAQAHSNNQVFMIGWLVHNNIVIDRLKQEGIIILDDTNKNRFDIINHMPQAQAGDAIIFSAHGTRRDAIALAQSKGYRVYDLTCPYVYKTHKIIQQKLNKGYDVYFIGKENHPETNAILSIDDTIKLVSSDDYNNIINSKNKTFCTNQTTLSMQDTKNRYDLLQQKFPDIEVANDICDATTQRQNAVAQMHGDIDVCFIIGDIKSSNANELLKIAKSKCDSYLIRDYKDITNEMLLNKKYAAVIGAASCPNDVIDQTAIWLSNK